MKIKTHNPDQIVLVSRPMVAIMFLAPMTAFFLIATLASLMDGHWWGAILCALALAMVGSMLVLGVEWTTVNMQRADDQIGVEWRGWRSAKMTTRRLSQLSDLQVETDWDGDPSKLRLSFRDGTEPLLLPITANGGLFSHPQAARLSSTIERWVKG